MTPSTDDRSMATERKEKEQIFFSRQEKKV